MALPPLTSDTVLRDVQVDDHRLITWETGRRDGMGKTVLAYRLLDPTGATIFEGMDYSVPGCIDDDASLRGLLGFLTLRPGDVDSEFFDDYTAAQVEWRDEHAEHLSMWAMDPDEAAPMDAIPFPDTSGAYLPATYREVPA